MDPTDLCVCGHSRNHHDRYGLGRCLAADCTRCPGALTQPGTGDAA